MVQLTPLSGIACNTDGPPFAVRDTSFLLGFWGCIVLALKDFDTAPPPPSAPRLLDPDTSFGFEISFFKMPFPAAPGLARELSSPSTLSELEACSSHQRHS